MEKKTTSAAERNLIFSVGIISELKLVNLVDISVLIYTFGLVSLMAYQPS